MRNFGRFNSIVMATFFMAVLFLGNGCENGGGDSSGGPDVDTGKKYTITYEGLNGAKNPNPTSYTGGKRLGLLPAVSTDGAVIFDGWTMDGNKISAIPEDCQGDIVLTATWKPCVKFAVDEVETLNTWLSSRSEEGGPYDIAITEKSTSGKFTSAELIAIVGVLTKNPTKKVNLYLGETKGLTSIPAYAFQGFESLVSIYLPEGITSIDGYAFSGCSNLENIEIPTTVKSIGTKAFYECYSLRDVYVENLANWCKISFADDDAFPLSYFGSSGKIHVTGSSSVNLTIPNECKSIRDSMFINCEELTSVTIPDSVTSIGEDAFYGCTGLMSVTIPGSVTYIDGWAFSDCTGLKAVYAESIESWCKIDFQGYGSNPLGYANHLYVNNSEITDLVIPNGVTSIGYSVFKGCTGLTSVTIPDSVTYIGNSAFNGCTGLTSITIPDSVTSIGEDAFYGCTGLTSITIPDNVISIGDSAFSGCTGLTSVTIPDSVTSIGRYAFNNCSELKAVYAESIEAWCKIDFAYGSNPLGYANHLYVNNSEITDLVIPSSVSSIGNYAFYGCKGLTRVTIPDSVTYIGWSAFSGCAGLESVLFENKTGWFYTGDYNATSGTSIDVTSSDTNAVNLRSNYSWCNSYLKRQQ